MGQDTKASDWQFAGVLSGGISVVAAASAWTFTFKSAKAAHQEDFVLVAKGIASPGAQVEVSWPDVEAEDLAWSSIPCKRAFSAKELHGSEAHVVTGGVSAVMWGYSELFADAGKASDPLFVAARNNGFALGPQLEIAGNVGEFSGAWYSIGDLLSKVVIPAMKGGVVLVGVATGLFQAGDALLKGRADAIRNAFFSGYAQALADLTSDKFSESKTAWSHEKLLRLDPVFVIRTELDKYKAKGSSGSPFSIDNAREAGQAFVLQDVDSFIKTRGTTAYYAAVKRHQDLYGARDAIRQDRYLTILISQFKSTGRLFGVRFES